MDALSHNFTDADRNVEDFRRVSAHSIVPTFPGKTRLSDALVAELLWCYDCCVAQYPSLQHSSQSYRHESSAYAIAERSLA
jgi:hypothetical protein